MSRRERLERIGDRDAGEAESLQQAEHARRPRRGPASVCRVGGVRDHHERRDTGGDRAPVRRNTRGKRRRIVLDRDRRVVRRDGRQAEPREVLERRRDAAVEKPGGERRHVLGDASRDRREPPSLPCDERALGGRHVGDRREVDVDAEPLERLRGRAAAAAKRALGQAAELVCRRGRRRPPEAPYRPALLVGHDQQPAPSHLRGRAQRRRQHAHLRGRAHVAAHEDHAADTAGADPLEQRRGGRRSIDPDHEPNADEPVEPGRRRCRRTTGGQTTERGSSYDDESRRQEPM